MITYEDECVGCPTEMGCMVSACPYRDVPYLYCDKCEGEVEKLYKYEGQEICEECLLKEFEVIE